MRKSLSYKTTAFTLSILLVILSASPLFALSEKTITPADVRSVFVGAFTVKVPTDWKSFNENEAADLRRQYMAQSKEIYRQFSGSDDQSKSVDVGAFHISGDAGSFVIVSFTVPPKSDLITLLKNQVKDKMAWGVREGYIRKYLGIVSVDDKQFSGFYTKAIGKTGRIELSGGLEHKKLKNTIIQLTLLCPKDWDEAKATSTLSSVLKSVRLKEKRSISSHDFSLRYDGVYRSAGKLSSGSMGYWYYLRFYSDGTVIEVSSTGQPEDLQKWFFKENLGLSRGKVTIQGNHLSFSAISTYGTVDYTGEIDGDKIHIRSYSHINQQRATNVYVFLKWQDKQGAPEDGVPRRR